MSLRLRNRRNGGLHWQVMCLLAPWLYLLWRMRLALREIYGLSCHLSSLRMTLKTVHVLTWDLPRFKRGVLLRWKLLRLVRALLHISLMNHVQLLGAVQTRLLVLYAASFSRGLVLLPGHSFLPYCLTMFCVCLAAVTAVCSGVRL